MLSETVDEDGQKVVGVPSLSPDFLIETYLDHQVSPDRCLLADAATVLNAAVLDRRENDSA